LNTASTAYLLPLKTKPVPMKIGPPVPTVDEPVLIIKNPLLPTLPAFAVYSSIAPELDAAAKPGTEERWCNYENMLAASSTKKSD